MVRLGKAVLVTGHTYSNGEVREGHTGVREGLVTLTAMARLGKAILVYGKDWSHLQQWRG